MTAPGRPRVVVTDATVLINLIHVDRLALLGALGGYEFVVPPEVEAEVSIPDQAAALARAFDAGHVARVSFTGTASEGMMSALEALRGPARGAIFALCEQGDQTLNRSPDHRAVVGASLFSRRLADMRDRADRGRALSARDGESVRASLATRPLSWGPIWAESGEREAAVRLTQTEIR